MTENLAYNKERNSASSALAAAVSNVSNPLGDATRRPTPDAELPALSAGVVRAGRTLDAARSWQPDAVELDSTALETLALGTSVVADSRQPRAPRNCGRELLGEPRSAALLTIGGCFVTGHASCCLLSRQQGNVRKIQCSALTVGQVVPELGSPDQ